MLEPRRELAVTRPISGGVKVALRLHMSHQGPIAEPCDLLFGVAPPALDLKGEDMAVAIDVLRRQDARQHLARIGRRRGNKHRLVGAQHRGVDGARRSPVTLGLVRDRSDDGRIGRDHARLAAGIASGVR